jgi:hypothetical protein
MTMAGQGMRIRDCAELLAGEAIEAWHKGRLFHRGRVIKVLPSTGLFWMEDLKSGARRLLDVEALDVVRADPPKAQATPDPQRAEQPGLDPGHVWFSSA